MKKGNSKVSSAKPKNSKTNFPMGAARTAGGGIPAVGSTKLAGKKASLPKRSLGTKVKPMIPDARSGKGVNRKA